MVTVGPWSRLEMRSNWEIPGPIQLPGPRDLRCFSSCLNPWRNYDDGKMGYGKVPAIIRHQLFLGEISRVIR